MRQTVRFPGESPEHRRARLLRDRVDHLRGARSRIIAAADAERRRIERDLHDGAQQRLIAVAVTLGLAESQIHSDPANAAKLIAQAREEAQLAVKELRELARGIHPAVLSDHGLAAALESLASRAPVPVEVSGVPSEPLGSDVEAAAYFATAEALTNITKHAHADHAFVVLSLEHDCLCVEIRDDGVGGADPSTGSGLRGLRDRVDALDGNIEVESPPGVGTTVSIELPLPSSANGGR
jgi:signal transduction histidine kinase